MIVADTIGADTHYLIEDDSIGKETVPGGDTICLIKDGKNPSASEIEV